MHWWTCSQQGNYSTQRGGQEYQPIGGVDVAAGAEQHFDRRWSTLAVTDTLEQTRRKWYSCPCSTSVVETFGVEWTSSDLGQRMKMVNGAYLIGTGVIVNIRDGWMRRAHRINVGGSLAQQIVSAFGY